MFHYGYAVQREPVCREYALNLKREFACGGEVIHSISEIVEN